MTFGDKEWSELADNQRVLLDELWGEGGTSSAHALSDAGDRHEAITLRTIVGELERKGVLRIRRGPQREGRRWRWPAVIIMDADVFAYVTQRWKLLSDER